ncbi:MAG: lytic murein transglycosylase [Thiolinea sp.]
MQFLPSGYNQHAVDYDGDGRRDSIRSKADALASAANLLRQWLAGRSALAAGSESATGNELPLARLDNKLPLAQWAQQGVTEVSGAP